MKQAFELLVFTASFLIASCNNGDASVQSTKSNGTSANTESHQAHYACPMHPEVTGNKGEKCPKCGMTLEPKNMASSANSAYFMEFRSTPSVIEPNKEVTLSLTPKKKEASNEEVSLDVEHEKKIHLILVSDDLSWFDHVHPEYKADGSYTVKAKFPAPGKYKAFADYKPAGGAPIVDKLEITVAGAAPAARTFTTDKLSGNSGNYTFTMEPAGGHFVTGPGMQIKGIVKKSGQSVDPQTLGNYLGAKAHIVVISLNEKEYLHVHPEVKDGRFDIHTTFTKPGLYRGWVQFNADNKLHTIDFTMNVKQGAAADRQKENDAHKSADEHTGHSH